MPIDQFAAARKLREDFYRDPGGTLERIARGGVVGTAQQVTIDLPGMWSAAIPLYNLANGAILAELERDYPGLTEIVTSRLPLR